LNELSEFHPLDRKACLEAAKLRHTHGLSSIDAMIVRIAIVSDCKMLLTTDRASLANRLKYSHAGIKIKIPKVSDELISLIKKANSGSRDRGLV